MQVHEAAHRRKGSGLRREGSRGSRVAWGSWRARKGDLLVQQMRSGIGATTEQLRALASLGIGKIGRTSVVRSGRTSVMRQIHQVRHLVAVKPLTWDAYQRVYPEREVPELDTIPYAVDGRGAHRYQVDDANFLAVEVYEDAFSLTWTTELPIASVLDSLGPQSPDESDDLVITVFDPATRTPRQFEEDKASRTLSTLRRANLGYPFVRLEFDDLVLAWRAPTYPTHIDDDIAPGELGVIATSFDSGYLEQLIKATAPPAIGRVAGHLVESAASAVHAAGVAL